MDDAPDRPVVAVDAGVALLELPVPTGSLLLLPGIVSSLTEADKAVLNSFTVVSITDGPLLEDILSCVVLLKLRDVKHTNGTIEGVYNCSDTLVLVVSVAVDNDVDMAVATADITDNTGLLLLLLL
jgi:hypothetical protein